jgi:general secretion pathway protein G
MQRQFLKRARRSERGVTLVEMMVVIVIIGLITAIVAINVLPAQDRARVEKAHADIAMLEQALELYRLDKARYPTMEEGLAALAAPPAQAGVTSTGATSYVRRLPNDPWGHAYQYVSPGQHGAFDLYSFGADAQEGGEGNNADIGNWQ